MRNPDQSFLFRRVLCAPAASSSAPAAASSGCSLRDRKVRHLRAFPPPNGRLHRRDPPSLPHQPPILRRTREWALGMKAPHRARSATRGGIRSESSVTFRRREAKTSEPPSLVDPSDLGEVFLGRRAYRRTEDGAKKSPYLSLVGERGLKKFKASGIPKMYASSSATTSSATSRRRKAKNSETPSLVGPCDLAKPTWGLPRIPAFKGTTPEPPSLVGPYDLKELTRVLRRINAFKNSAMPSASRSERWWRIFRGRIW
mmetsp:Transcript_620/g.1582  ORF Transcript_620/g.1582 Transcript_620/m.1582 type:complete len:257 (+) Transcript_620:300-1070(+)